MNGSFGSRPRAALAAVLQGLLSCGPWVAGAEPEVLEIWPGTAPDEPGNIGPEQVQPANPKEDPPTKRLTNVTRPTISVFRPESDRRTHTAVIVCPGGGHRILAWDKEGTEIAAWLTSLGVTGIVLKYRVPARDESRRWRAAVQDAQRTVSLARSKAVEWGIDPQKLGILGFSAGGEVAALTALFDERQYERVDVLDDVPSRPDFAALVYPAYLVDKDASRLQPHVRVTEKSPPMFLAHAGDDRVSPLNSVLLYLALKQANVPAELHVYASGGHGFGMRPSDEPCSTWPQRCEAWLRRSGWLDVEP